MKILVTGATGFIGRHLVRRLLNDRHEIHALTRPETDQNPLESTIVHTHLGSTQNMIEIMEAAKPDAVIHLASLFIGEHKSADVEALINSNVVLSTQLAEAMSVNEVRLLINVGTSWQHYADADYNPVNLYAATKQAFRSVLSFYLETSDLRVINLEVFDTFGPNDQREKLFNLLNRLRVTGETISMSPGNQFLDPIYIDDVCDAFLVALDRLQSGRVKRSETYSVCSGESIQLKELIKIYENVSKTKLNVDWGGRPYKTREVMHPWAGGVRLPGWSPKVSIEEGIKILLKSYV